MQGAVNMVENVAGCRKVLVGTGWASNWLIAFSQMGLENVPSHHCMSSISGTEGTFGWSKTVTSQGLIISGCG